jgi:uncharacterized protein YegJ (DUF2314 family)
LIFKIAVEGDEHGAVERMWVIVRERTPTGYIGMLDNEPNSKRSVLDWNRIAVRISAYHCGCAGR